MSELIGVPHNWNRLFEWAATLNMIILAVILGVDPTALGLGALKLLLQTGLNAQALSALLSFFALVRIVGLYANGTWPGMSPWLRMAGASAMFLIWLQAIYALVRFPIMGGGFIPIITSFCASHAFGEFVSVIRAVQDVRR